MYSSPSDASPQSARVAGPSLIVRIPSPWIAYVPPIWLQSACPLNVPSSLNVIV